MTHQIAVTDLLRPFPDKMTNENAHPTRKLALWCGTGAIPACTKAHLRLVRAAVHDDAIPHHLIRYNYELTIVGLNASGNYTHASDFS